jgi:FkbM family methyltransferase
MLDRVLNRLFPLRQPAERARRSLLAVPLTAGDVAIDCGANVGEITAHLARSGATVYAFEPNPHAFAVLQARFAQRPNVRCLPQAVLDFNGVQRLFFHEHSDQDEVHWSTGSSLLDYKRNVLKHKFVDVAVVDLSEFIASLGGRVKLLKIDVEGVEAAILTKLIATGTIHRIDHVYVETHQRVPELTAGIDELRRLVREQQLTHINLDWT